MVKIVKDNKVLTVTKSAFKNFYENAGWSVLSGTPSVDVKAEEVANTNSMNTEDSTDEWDGYEEEAEQEEIEKPLSEMNREELTEKALAMGLDISKVTSNKQLRELIKSHM
jgi:hypothetical protein